MKKTSWKGLAVLWFLSIIIGSLTGTLLCIATECASPTRLSGVFIETGAVISLASWFYFRSQEKKEK